MPDNAVSTREGDLRRLMNLTAIGITLAGVILLSVILFAGWRPTAVPRHGRKLFSATR